MVGRSLNVEMTAALDQELRSKYNKYIDKIYRNAVYDRSRIHKNTTIDYENALIRAHTIPIDSYYQSWLLRGDNPDLYFDYEELERKHFITFWDSSGLNKICEEVSDARRNILARSIYYAYHFDANVREQGDKTTEFTITDDYIQYISDVQLKMQERIAKLQIAIECNPTSNRLIGCMPMYENHPISKFFDQGLNNPTQSPQISVSINTDDLGVFPTSTENEYALLAIAQEKKNLNKDNNNSSNRSTYDWLERIRCLGFEQRFKVDNKIEK